MAESRGPGLDNSYSAVCRSSSCFEQQIATFSVELIFRMLGLFGSPSKNLRFKFARSGKIRRI